MANEKVNMGPEENKTPENQSPPGQGDLPPLEENNCLLYTSVVIAVGYGKTQGVAHKSKSIREVVKTEPPYPDWFTAGVNAALLAPTAMNQQKFTFALHRNLSLIHI